MSRPLREKGGEERREERGERDGTGREEA